MKLLIVYFSATGNTEKIALALRDRCLADGHEVSLRDITTPEGRREGITSREYDGIFFGFPIHSHRAPRIARQWLETLEGGGVKCATFFTYGAFTVHPCHWWTRAQLEGRGFRLVSSAEFLGFHTFNLGGWRAAPGRPDGRDYAVAEEFARRTLKRFSGEDEAVPGEFPRTDMTEKFLDDIEQFRFMVLTELPSRRGADCGMCMKCAELCPSGAMDAVKGEADPGRCIACLRCVAVCPEGAIKINDMKGSWGTKLEMEGLSEEEACAKQSAIYL